MLCFYGLYIIIILDMDKEIDPSHSKSREGRRAGCLSKP
jgi:hypothetical protein